jgi:hypothetical protein
VAVQTQSTRQLARLRDLRRDLDPWADQPAVRDLSDALA